MRVMHVRKLRGASAWSATAALCAVVGDVPEGTISPLHLQQLDEQLDGLCVPPQLAKEVARRRAQRRGLPEVGAFVVELAGELQCLCCEFHGARDARRTEAHSVWNVALECREIALAEACLRAAVDYLNTLLLWNHADLSEPYRTLLATVEEVCHVSSPGLVVSAARARGIPVFRMGPDHALRLAPDEVLQLGEGIHQRRVHPWGTMTDRTGYLAGHLANDKAFVKALWEKYGIPVPKGFTVSSEAGALNAAAALGEPVVVKPVDADCGQGLTLRPATPEALSAAFGRAMAASISGNLIVERYLPGAWHRLLVVDQRLVGALRRDAARVVGDGRHTIRELVEESNRDSRRGPDARWPLRFLCLEEHELEFLAEQGLNPDTVLAAGTRAILRRTATAASGAESFDVTDLVHPETEALALEAVGLVGLDIAGLDLIASDISRPLREQQGGFLEINETPAIFVHAAPLCTPPRPAGEAIVESLFPENGDGRVPSVIVIGRDHADRAALLLAEMLTGDGRVVGLSTPARTCIDNRPTKPGGPSLPERLEVLLRHPQTEAVVVSDSLRDVLESGLGTDRCTVLVLADEMPEPLDDEEFEQERDRLVRRLIVTARRVVVAAGETYWQPWIEGGASTHRSRTECDEVTGSNSERPLAEGLAIEAYFALTRTSKTGVFRGEASRQDVHRSMAATGAGCK